MKKIYSFDIFDTCLGRICGAPRNIFDVMAIRVLGERATVTQINDFSYVRILAEKNARKSSKNNEVTLEDIYSFADFSSYTDLSSKELMRLEMMIEKENLYPIKNICDIISKLHRNGKNILFISDMYLPSEFLISILMEFDIWKKGDKLYLSCEHGKMKSNGKLFDYIKNSERICIFDKWVHYGDNFRSDFLIPSFKGIICHRANTKYSKYQSFINNLNIKPGWNITSIASGISKSILLQLGDTYRNRFAADLIAPIYVPFVYHILSSSRKRNIKKLFFLSRDGYLLFKIAEQLNHLFPEISCSYLYASRKSLYLPGIKSLDKDSLKDLLVSSNKYNIRETLDNFQINFSDEEYNEIINSDNAVEYICNTDYLFNRIRDRWVEQKLLSIEYFKQEGLANDDVKSAIVDLRGSRKSQISINHILTENGYNSVFGYYLEVTSRRVLNESNDKYESIYFMNNIINNNLMKGLYDGKYLLEHYFSITPFKRCSGYKKEGQIIRPLFDENEYISKSAESSCALNQKICIKYAERMEQLGICDKSMQILELGLAALSDFLIQPDRYYLKALIGIDMSQTQYKRKEMVKYINPFDLFKKNIAWYEGSIKLTFGRVGLWLYYLGLPVIKKIYRWIQ